FCRIADVASSHIYAPPWMLSAVSAIASSASSSSGEHAERRFGAHRNCAGHGRVSAQIDLSARPWAGGKDSLAWLLLTARAARRGRPHGRERMPALGGGTHGRGTADS